MFKRIGAVLLSVVLIGANLPIEARAEYRSEKDGILSKSVSDVVFLLRKVFEDRYSAAEEEVKELVRDNGYDYGLTMDSFYDQESPFKNADYVRYLAAYMSCKKYAKDHSMDSVQLREIPFLTADTEVDSAEEYVPTKIDEYKELEDREGEYYLSGDRYLMAPSEIEVYDRIENGNFIKTGETRLVSPERKNVNFLKVTLSVIEPDDIFGFMGIDREAVEDDYERRTEVIKRVSSNESIAQTLMVTLPDEEIPMNEALLEYASYIDSTEGIRKTILMTALSLIGKVPYEWGGKASAPGYDTKWWTYNEENGLQHGLDCSGFVQWTFMTSGFPREIYSRLTSTKDILSSMDGQISRDELKPGDIGVTNRPGGATNQTGIYLGDGKWCHCSSGKKTVTVSEYGSFCVFYDPVKLAGSYDEAVIEDYARVLSDGLYITNGYNIPKNIDTYNSLYYTLNYTNEDVMLLSKLISLKARGDGINCQVAMAEVMRNRVESDMFPGSLYEVITQQADINELDLQEPTDDMINTSRMVLGGKLSVLDCKDAIFYYDLRDLEDDTDDGTEETEYRRWTKTIGSFVFYSL